MGFPFLYALNVLNALWFTSAFVFFALVPSRAASLLAPRTLRSSPLYETLIAVLPFLGGMNLAFAVLSLLLVLSLADWSRLLAAVLAVAHATQFLGQVPLLNDGRTARRSQLLSKQECAQTQCP
jgi:hypothetical protein